MTTPEAALQTVDEKLTEAQDKAKELVGAEGVEQLAEAGLVIVPTWIVSLLVKVLQPQKKL